MSVLRTRPAAALAALRELEQKGLLREMRPRLRCHGATVLPAIWLNAKPLMQDQVKAISAGFKDPYGEAAGCADLDQVRAALCPSPRQSH